MADYEEGKFLSNDDVNAMFLAGDDPVTFEETVKSKKQKDAQNLKQTTLMFLHWWLNLTPYT